MQRAVVNMRGKHGYAGAVARVELLEDEIVDRPRSQVDRASAVAQLQGRKHSRQERLHDETAVAELLEVRFPQARGLGEASRLAAFDDMTKQSNDNVQPNRRS